MGRYEDPEPVPSSSCSLAAHPLSLLVFAIVVVHSSTGSGGPLFDRLDSMVLLVEGLDHLVDHDPGLYFPRDAHG
jgi:hypothetical protein